MVMVERTARVRQALEASRRALSAERQIEIIHADALAWLRTAAPAPFDLVFLDPPYDAHLLTPCCAALQQGGWLNPGARIYLENATRGGFPDLPSEWNLIRDRQAGQVRFGLAATGD